MRSFIRFAFIAVLTLSVVQVALLPLASSQIAGSGQQGSAETQHGGATWRWFEPALIAMMFVGVLLVFSERSYAENLAQKALLTVRTIQLAAVVFLFPSILILAIEDKLKGDALATLLGAIVGYLLSGFGKEEEEGKAPPKVDKGPHAQAKTNGPANLITPKEPS